ncbi:MAG: hypothetical protein E1N59_3245 [Puniceicoccaceae bacterium 5H]|nr:MAG: hypothetical protein E1N59_3245 [Puniceicoccaceae bacterium 5H]
MRNGRKTPFRWASVALMITPPADSAEKAESASHEPFGPLRWRRSRGQGRRLKTQLRGERA